MRKLLLVLTLAGATMIAPGLTPAAHARGFGWLSIGTGFRVGPLSLSFVLGNPFPGYAPAYYYRAYQPIVYPGYRCTTRCFVDHGVYYHDRGCPVVHHYFTEYRVDPYQAYISYAPRYDRYYDGGYYERHGGYYGGGYGGYYGGGYGYYGGGYGNYGYNGYNGGYYGNYSNRGYYDRNYRRDYGRRYDGYDRRRDFDRHDHDRHDFDRRRDHDRDRDRDHDRGHDRDRDHDHRGEFRPRHDGPGHP